MPSTVAAPRPPAPRTEQLHPTLTPEQMSRVAPHGRRRSVHAGGGKNGKERRDHAVVKAGGGGSGHKAPMTSAAARANGH